MSRVWEDRIWNAHPLTATSRLVLLGIARQVPDQQSEVLVNRTVLARELETSANMVRIALQAGEHLGLVEVLPNGRVAFCPEPLPLAAPVNKPEQPSVVPATGPAQATPMRATRTSPGGHVTPRWVLDEFARHWEQAYKQRYVYTPGKDHKLAALLAAALTSSELTARVTAYLNHPDPFYKRCTHSFSLFATRVNTFVSAPRATATATGPRDDEDEYDRLERKTRERQAQRVARA